MTKESIYELQRIDANCSNCGFLKRDVQQATTQKGKRTPIYAGDCLKYNKYITFIPDVCQIETQKCFVHRKDYLHKC